METPRTAGIRAAVIVTARPTCLPRATTSSSSRRCRSAQPTLRKLCARQSTTTSRSICRAIRSVCRRTNWCSRRPTGRRPRRCSPMSPARPAVGQCRRRVRHAICRRKGEEAMIDFAQDWLAGLFGTRRPKGASRRAVATRWNARTVGAAARCRPRRPGSAGARRVLMEPLGDRIWFRRRSRARDVVGHGQRRLGVGRARGGSGVAQFGRQVGGAEEPAASARSALTARMLEAESPDRLVERQGQRLGAA